MNVTILGSGNMARGIATRALVGGNSVQVLSRDVDQRQALAEELRSFAISSETVAVGPLDEPLVGSLVVLAVPYPAATLMVKRYSEELRGKIVVDITNPVNDSSDGLVTKPDTSAAEEIARKLPGGTGIVKAFNTTFASTLVDGQVAGQPLDVFIAGDDPGARQTVRQLAEAGGLRALDVGPLSSARALEGFQLLHMMLQQQLDPGLASAVKIIS
jgi:8-hydroxy-5-deazaflavin:NADPH oxidoreductase